MISVFPLAIIPMLVPAFRITSSVNELRLLTAAPLAIFSPVTAPFASLEVVIAPSATEPTVELRGVIGATVASSTPSSRRLTATMGSVAETSIVPS
jgi:hypothetical protein